MVSHVHVNFQILLIYASIFRPRSVSLDSHLSQVFTICVKLDISVVDDLGQNDAAHLPPYGTPVPRQSGLAVAEAHPEVR